jgi:hypothetical protein
MATSGAGAPWPKLDNAQVLEDIERLAMALSQASNSLPAGTCVVVCGCGCFASVWAELPCLCICLCPVDNISFSRLYFSAAASPFCLGDGAHVAEQAKLSAISKQLFEVEQQLVQQRKTIRDAIQTSEHIVNSQLLDVDAMLVHFRDSLPASVNPATTAAATAASVSSASK